MGRAVRDETGGWGAAREGTGNGEAAREETRQRGAGQGHRRSGGQTHYHPYLFSDLVALQTLILLVTLNGMILKVTCCSFIIKTWLDTISIIFVARCHDKINKFTLLK